MGKSFAVVIAWPETYCKQPGAWYDGLIYRLGFGNEGYYKVGHAAVVLINSEGKCFYFDFGRYHSPYGYGRVRDVTTDHDLIINTKVYFEEDGTPILDELYDELNNNSSCHGDGLLRAGFVEVDFEQSFACAKAFQNREKMPYGPFTKKGTNCSRFVRDVALKGSSDFVKNTKLRLAWMLTPTPMWNVKSVGEHITVADVSIEKVNTEVYEVA